MRLKIVGIEDIPKQDLWKVLGLRAPRGHPSFESDPTLRCEISVTHGRRGLKNVRCEQSSPWCWVIFCLLIKGAVFSTFLGGFHGIGQICCCLFRESTGKVWESGKGVLEGLGGLS